MGDTDTKELKEFCEESASDLSNVPSPPFPAPHDAPQGDGLKDHSGGRGLALRAPLPTPALPGLPASRRAHHTHK